jgi:hypothetical protein
MNLQEKERIRLVADLRALLPELLLVLGSIDRLQPPPDVSSRVRSARSQLEALVERARGIEESTDCMPAAAKGRQQREA